MRKHLPEFLFNYNMKNFNYFFNEDTIIKAVFKLRVKLARSRSKKHLLHLLTSNQKYNYNKKSEQKNDFEKYNYDLIKKLQEITPPRKKWVDLGSDHRKKRNSQETLATPYKNFYSLIKTYKKYKAKNSQDQWFINLNNFVSEILENVIREDYNIMAPIVFPKLKDKKIYNDINVCRPICMFSLKDRIILSITNKFLTQLFDSFFEDSSFAFRSKKNVKNLTVSHHDCITNILEYRNKHLNEDLFVVECDMEKFYDTVNHKITLNLFNQLIKKSKEKYPSLKLDVPINIFKKYLDCYAFNFNVPSSEDENYWKSYNIDKGLFKWIDENELKKYYTEKDEVRLGVPQGGALSGLIANIYLNEADIKLNNNKILYQRFCDDMIIISNKLEYVNTAKLVYINALQSLNLFPHNFREQDELLTINENKLNFKNYWKGKSKGPFKWNSIENGGIPWIGFVGYEIDYKGNIRVRKSSLKKELNKQKKITQEITNVIKTHRRKPIGTASESAINRLIGMSVGRIKMHNFEMISTDLSWRNGFRELFNNPHSKKQINLLDMRRKKQYYRLLKKIQIEEENISENSKRQIIKYDKPFSYFYQILERK